MLQFTDRCHKPGDVHGRRGWLDNKLRVLVSCVTPTTDIDVELSVIFLVSRKVPGEDAEDNSRFELRSIFDGKRIGAVAKATSQSDLGTGPLIIPIDDLKVKRALAELTEMASGMVSEIGSSGDTLDRPSVRSQCDRNQPGTRTDGVCLHTERRRRQNAQGTVEACP